MNPALFIVRCDRAFYSKLLMSTGYAYYKESITTLKEVPGGMEEDEEYKPRRTRRKRILCGLRVLCGYNSWILCGLAWGN
jgi:hypothetical protein